MKKLKRNTFLISVYGFTDAERFRFTQTFSQFFKLLTLNFFKRNLKA